MNRIREWRRRRDLTLEQLGAVLGTSNQQISRLEKGERRLTVDWLLRFAKALQVDPDDLLDPADRLRGPRASGDDDMRQPIGNPSAASGLSDRIPVLGAARGGADQEMYLDDPIDWVHRPTMLRDVRGAYAIYVVGESMTPRYRPGTLLFVNPFKPPRWENGVVIQMLDRTVLVKEFLGFTPQELKLLQYNPETELTLQRETISVVHTVVGTQEP
jgi:phage repressor protein C with HTH and peptisase S24 domain